MVYKWCVVPKCTNTTINTPDKLFVSVPTVRERRRMWLKLARRDPDSILPRSNVFMCEDHFDMEKDIVNYMKYKMGFSMKLFLTDEAVPTKFHCQKDRKRRRPYGGSSRKVFLKKQRIDITELLKSQNTTETHAECLQKDDHMEQEKPEGLIKQEIKKEPSDFDNGCEQSHQQLRLTLHHEIHIKEEPEPYNPYESIPQDNSSKAILNENKQHDLINADLKRSHCELNEDEQFKSNLPLLTNLPYECDSCEKQFTTACQLRRHNMQTHRPDKSFKCEICDNQCRASSSFKMHMRIHTGKRPFQCSICDKRFIQLSTLKYHIRSHKPLDCNSCDKQYSRLFNLKRHMRNHTGKNI